MGWCHAYPPINPSPIPWSFPTPDYFSASPKEFCSPFQSSFSLEDSDAWSNRGPPINTSKNTYFPEVSYDNPVKEFWSPFTSSFSPEDTWSYPYPPIRDVLIANKLCEGGWNEPCADGNKPTDALCGETVSDGCGDSNGKLITVESMGSAAVAHNWNSKEKSSESKAAWNISREKDTGEGGAAGEYHTCEELSGRGSCGNACYTCAEADHFARKCTLGAHCGWSGHHRGGNSTLRT